MICFFRLDWDHHGEYTMFVGEGRVRMLMLGVPHTSGLRVGVLEWCDAEGTEALLWTGSSPFSDV